jgi:SAM-dependent methyltransferase
VPKEEATAYNSEATTIFTSDIFQKMWAESWGDGHVAELETLSTTSWDTLGRVIGTLRLKPDDVLVDLGCGRGGPGLWLARAFNSRLIGVDHSPPLVELAREWAGQWVGEGRAEFQLGTLAETGLPDSSVDGIFTNALPALSDVPAALAEIGRILRPGGRIAFTQNENILKDDHKRWPELLEAAGLTFMSREEMPDAVEAFRRLHTAVNENRQLLLDELGEAAATYVFNDADDYGPLLDNLRWAMIVARRP